MFEYKCVDFKEQANILGFKTAFWRGAHSAEAYSAILNYHAKDGWEFVQFAPTSMGMQGWPQKYVFFFKRKLEGPIF